MKIETRAFGQIEIDDDRVMKFVGPMLGFEDADRYALVDMEPGSPFKIMQLVSDSDVSFLVTDPTVFFPDYRVQLSEKQAAEIELTDPGKAAVMVVVNIEEGGARLTANLYAPVIVNAQNLLGKQIILKGSAYKIDEPLAIQAVAG
ncbi:MAG: flagellar assembly protein FliW [Deferrisomatales bacterium]|nr:flagellar assembly protein FliW [Deferrisomatales bacterium]